MPIRGSGHIASASTTSSTAAGDFCPDDRTTRVDDYPVCGQVTVATLAIDKLEDNIIAVKNRPGLTIP